MGITFQGSLVKSRGKLNRAAPKLVLKRAPAAFVGDLEADIGGGFWGGFGPPSPWQSTAVKPVLAVRTCLLSLLS